MKQTSSEKSAGVYDQTANLAVSNLTVETPEGSATIASIASTGDMKAANLADLVKFRDQFNALMTASVEEKPVDPAVVETLKGMKAFFKDYVTKGELNTLVFKDASGQEAFKMDKVTFDGSWLSFDQPKSNLNFDLRFNGITAPSAAAMPEMAMFGQFIPSKFGVGITIEDVPSNELWGAFLSVMAAQHDPTVMDMAAEQAGQQIVQAAQQAGSTFKLNGWEYDSQGIKLNLGGSVKADTSAMMGAIASLNLDLVGFDTILGMAQMFGGGDPSTTAPLETLKQLSNRTTTSDGQPKDSFAIDLANTGDVTVNGKPFNPMAMPVE